MKISLKYLLIALCLASTTLAAHQVQAATYYVDPSAGSDGNAGSKTAPWQNVPGSRNSTSYLSGSGWKKIVAGDSIVIKSGSTLRTRISIDSTWYNSGTTAQPIIITRDPAWGSGPVTIDGTGLTFGSWDALLFIYKVHNVIVDGVTTNGIVVQNSGAYGVNAAGGGEASRLQGFVLKNAKLFNNTKFNAMIQSCDNFTISNVLLDGNLKNTQESGGFHIGGDNSSGCTNGLVTNCISRNNGAVPGSQAGGSDALQGFWLTNSTNVTFRNCVAYNNAGRGFDIGVVSPVTVVTNNVKVINCEAWNNSVGFGCNLDNVAGAANIYFLNCISRNNGMGFDIYEGPSAYLYHCLIIGNRTGIYIDAPVFSNRTTYVEIKNSIFKSTSTDMEVFQIAGLTNKTIVSDRNHWEFGTQKMAVYWNDSTVYDPYFYDSKSSPGSSTRSYYVNHRLDGNSTSSVDGIFANFANEGAFNFRPTSRSGMLQKGQILSNPNLPELAYDKDSNLRPAGTAWDIGPYQMSADKPAAPVDPR